MFWNCDVHIMIQYLVDQSITLKVSDNNYIGMLPCRESEKFYDINASSLSNYNLCFNLQLFPWDSF